MLAADDDVIISDEIPIERMDAFADTRRSLERLFTTDGMGPDPLPGQDYPSDGPGPGFPPPGEWGPPEDYRPPDWTKPWTPPDM